MKLKHPKSLAWSFNQQLRINKPSGSSWSSELLSELRKQSSAVPQVPSPPHLLQPVCVERSTEDPQRSQVGSWAVSLWTHSLPSFGIFLWGLCSTFFLWLSPGSSGSSSENIQPWATHNKRSKSSWSCPQMISSLNTKVSHFFLWLLEVCWGWEQNKHSQHFLVGVQTAFMLNMIWDSRFGEFWEFSSHA